MIFAQKIACPTGGLVEHWPGVICRGYASPLSFKHVSEKCTLEDEQLEPENDGLEDDFQT